MAILRSTQVQGKLEVIDNDLYVLSQKQFLEYLRYKEGED